MEQGNQVAQTILEQLGGKRFITMTGARNFVADTKSLQFALPSRFAADGINLVRITLDETDTYKVEYFNLRGVNLTLVRSSEGIYADMLAADFRRETGLDTKL